jgi:DNA-binding transcriptional MerR regulator
MKIKEITKLFGITPDTVRFYEDKGLIHPKRDKNGYREYSIWDVMALSDCLKYKGFGLALNAIKEIKEKNHSEYYSNLLKDQIESIREDIFQKQMLLDTLESYQGYLEFAKMNVGNYWYQTDPELKLFVLTSLEVGIFRNFNPDDSNLIQWINQINDLSAYVMISTDLFLSADRIYTWCYGVDKHIFEMLHLPEGKGSITLPSGAYLHTIIYILDSYEAFTKEYKQMLSELKRRKLCVKGDIVCRLLERDLLDKNWYSLFELIIPVEKIN